MGALKLAVFASGTGSNLKALLDAIAAGRLDAEMRVVVSNKAEAGALQIARDRGVPACHLAPQPSESEAAYGQRMLATLQAYEVEFVALAGYLKKVPAAVVRAFKHRMLNIHPALLPSFGGKGMYGLRVHQAVLEYGCKVSGVTVHLVDEDYDTGPPVLQRCVPVEPDDTPEVLARRVLQVEHQVYAEALQLFAEDRVEVRGRNVIIKPRAK